MSAWRQLLELLGNRPCAPDEEDFPYQDAGGQQNDRRDRQLEHRSPPRRPQRR